MIILDEFLIVKTADGKEWQIMVLDTFSVDLYPKKEYIAYTFGEEVDNDNIKSYISILNENDDYFTLEEITNSDEQNIVKEAYTNMILESSEV